MKANVLSHPKFKRLKRRLGLPEFQVVGILESIWHIAAGTGERDGAIGHRLSNEDIAATIEWPGNADELISAMVECGWLDLDPIPNRFRLVVHDWSDHCPSYIKGGFGKSRRKFADKLINAEAIATSYKLPPIGSSLEGVATNPIQSNPIQSSTHPTPPTGGSGGGGQKSADIDPDNPDLPEGVAPTGPVKPRGGDTSWIMEVWNEGRGPNQPGCRDWKPPRQKKARAILKYYKPEEIREAIARMARSGFCNGGGKGGWKASVDFLLKSDTVTKVLEGIYDNPTGGAGKRVDRTHLDGGDWSKGEGKAPEAPIPIPDDVGEVDRWGEVLEALGGEIDEEGFETYIKHLQCLAITPEQVWLVAPNEFNRSMLHGYKEQIEAATAKCMGYDEPPSVHILVREVEAEDDDCPEECGKTYPPHAEGPEIAQEGETGGGGCGAAQGAKPTESARNQAGADHAV